MHDANTAKLEQLGLSIAEAQIYLAILHHGPLAAAAIAHETRIKRPSVYPILCSLGDKGLIEGGAGYGSKFAAIAPDEALPALVRREKQTIAERERIADELAEILTPLAADVESTLDDTVQVVSTPQVISERFNRLQLEAERQIEGFIKAPILLPRRGNPTQKKARRRGVQYRGLYERAVLDDPKVRPYLGEWAAGGEEIRVYDGELPYKLAVFDSRVAIFTLVRRSGQPSAVFVRHAPFAKSMSILFESFWNEAEPLTATAAPAHPGSARASRAADGASPSGGKIVSAGAPKPPREGACAPRTKKQANRAAHR
jgi:sugar-specific transcriptional regulator TrmB